LASFHLDKYMSSGIYFDVNKSFWCIIGVIDKIFCQSKGWQSQEAFYRFSYEQMLKDYAGGFVLEEATRILSKWKGLNEPLAICRYHLATSVAIRKIISVFVFQKWPFEAVCFHDSSHPSCTPSLSRYKQSESPQWFTDAFKFYLKIPVLFSSTVVNLEE
jgi:hypothetical protein